MGSHVHQRDILLGKTSHCKKTYIQKMHQKNSAQQQVSGLNLERQKTMDDISHLQSSFMKKYKKYIDNVEGKKHVYKSETAFSDDEEYLNSALPPLKGTRRRKSGAVILEQDTDTVSKSSLSSNVNWNDIVKSKRSKSDVTKDISVLQNQLSSTPHLTPTPVTSAASSPSGQESPGRRRSVKAIVNPKRSPRLDTPSVVRRDTAKSLENLSVNPLIVLPEITPRSPRTSSQDASPSSDSGSRRVHFFDDEDGDVQSRFRVRRNTLDTGMLSKYIRSSKLAKNTLIPAIAEEPLSEPNPRLTRSKSYGDINLLKRNSPMSKDALRLMVDQSRGPKKFEYAGKLAQLGLEDFKADREEVLDKDDETFSDIKKCRYLRIMDEHLDDEVLLQMSLTHKAPYTKESPDQNGNETKS